MDLMYKLYFIFIFSAILNADIYDYDIKPQPMRKSKFMDIKILDSKELKFSDSDIKELSDLAYKDNILYVIGDKGYLFHFKIKIENDKIKELTFKSKHKLKNSNSNRLKKNKRDSEGLAFLGNDLLISFEREPRVELFSTKGISIKNEEIHNDLTNKRNYKDENKALESVAYNKKYGVITAPEKGLKSTDKKYHTIYSKNKTWKFLADGKISALEFIDKDRLMILQREFGFLSTTVTISSLNLKNLEYKILAKLDSTQGWKLDNFEGLTKIDEKKYLMISDDDNNFLQKTLLVLFEVD